MKKIVIPIFCLLLILPLITKTSINNRNYELDATTEVYTKAEVDSKLAELRKSIESNTTTITETRNLLTTIQNSLKNYALKTALIEANSNIDNLLTIANNNTKRIDELSNKKTSIEGSARFTQGMGSSIRNIIILNVTGYTKLTINFTSASATVYLYKCNDANGSSYSAIKALPMSGEHDVSGYNYVMIGCPTYESTTFFTYKLS